MKKAPSATRTDGAIKRTEPRLRDVLSDCNRDALRYSQRVDIAANGDSVWLDQHEQDFLTVPQRWFRRIIALFILLPIGALALFANVSLLSKTEGHTHIILSIPVWFTLLGAMLWLVFYYSKICDSLFLYLYVYGHELTHRIAIFLSGGKVDEFNVSTDGGHVITDKNTMFIALSPYFIPIWVLAWLLLSLIAVIFLPWQAIAPFAFIGIGFFWAFHFTWTLWIIPKDQPDLNENGTFFSLMIIYLSNLALITLALSLTGAFSLAAFAREFMVHSKIFVDLVADIIKWGSSFL